MDPMLDARFLPGLVGQRRPPHPMLERLDWLIGTWEIMGDYHVEGEIISRQAIFTHDWVLGGNFLRWKIVSHGPLKFYENLGMIGWNEETQDYRGSYQDSIGTNDHIHAKWERDDLWVIRWDKGFIFLGPTVKRLQCRVERHSDTETTWHLEADRGNGFEYLILQRGKKLYPFAG